MKKELLSLLCFVLLIGCSNTTKPSENDDNDTVIKNEETTTTPAVTTTIPEVTTIPEITTTTPVVTTTIVTTTTPIPETTKAPEITKAPETTKAPTTTTTTKKASSNAVIFDVEDKVLTKGDVFILMPPAGVTYDIVSEYPDVARVGEFDASMGGYSIKSGYTGTSTITVTAHQAGHKDTTKKFTISVKLDEDRGTAENPVYIEPEQKELAKQLFDLINDEREALGIPRWTWDESLYEAATIRSRDELPKEFAHNGSSVGAGTQEEIGRDRTNNPEQLLRNWKAAPAHWSNMMNNIPGGVDPSTNPFILNENRAAIAIWWNADQGCYYTTIYHVN